MMGITEKEYEFIIDEIYSENKIDFERHTLKTISIEYYNGYKFTETGQTIFNPMMTLYVLENIINFGSLPKNLTDNNLRIDYNQIAYIFGDNTQLRDQVNTSITNNKVWDNGFSLNVSFDMNAYKEGKYFAEGLFYSGILTFGEFADELRIPNLVTYEFVLNYFNRIMNFDGGSYVTGEIISPYSKKGDVKSMLELFFQKVIQEYPGDFFKNGNESFFHGLLFYVLWNTLHKDTYEVLPEYQLTNGQVDIMVRSYQGARVRHHLNDLFEVKRVARNATEEQFSAKSEEAKSSLRKYLTGKFKYWRGVAICFRGNKDYLIEVIENDN